MAKKKKSSKSKGKKRVKIRYVSAPPGGNGILDGIKKLLPDTAPEQFLVGLLIGAGAAYIVSDEQMRRQIIRYAMQTYSNLAGGFEELREQVADIQAELHSEHATQS